MAQLYLSELSLAHYRCFKELRLETDRRPVVLTGPNGAGKTSILEAVSLFSAGRGLRRAKADDMARLPGDVGWKVRCRMACGGGERDLSSWWKGGPGRRLEIDGKAARQAELGECLKVLWLTPAMDRLWSEGAEGRRRFLDRMAMSLFPDHAVHAVTYDRTMRERNRLLRSGCHDAGWFAVLEARMAESGAELTRRRLNAIARLAASYSQWESEFPEAGVRLESPAGASADATDAAELKAALREGRGKDMKVGRTLAGPHRADLLVEFKARNTAARSCSTGEQKALLISLALANARAVSKDFSFPPVLLLDEIAAHLDAGRLRLLLSEVRHLKAQTWMTGTEAALFDDIAGEARNFRITAGSEGSAAELIT